MTTGPPDAATVSLAAALALVQSQLPHIKKERTADVRTEKGSYSYSYADLAAVTEEVLPLLGRCGLAWVTRPTFNAEGKFVLAYELLHTSGERVSGEYPLPQSGTPQAMGSAITYARRYTLCSVTGVAPETDDDDAAHATEEARPRQTVQRAPRQDTQRVERPPVQQGGQTRVQRSDRPGPPLPDEQPAQADTVTDPQLAKLGAVFTGLGVKGDAARDERLRISSLVVGRALTTSRDLTKAEARRLIDVLERATPETLAAVVAEAGAGPGEAGQLDEWGTPVDLDGPVSKDVLGRVVAAFTRFPPTRGSSTNAGTARVRVAHELVLPDDAPMIPLDRLTERQALALIDALDGLNDEGRQVLGL